MVRMAILAGLLLLPSASMSIAHEHGTPPSANSTQDTNPALSSIAREEKARTYFTDLPVIAQDGKERRFFSDVLKDKIVLINLFYTNCTSICPVLNQKISGVQDLLGARLGSDITLISITTDPARDLPSVVKTYSQSFNPREGWLFLTGRTQDIQTIVRRLGHTSSDPADHVALLLIGDVGRAKWTKLKPTAAETEIAAMLEILVSERK